MSIDTDTEHQLNDRGLPGFGMSLHVNLGGCNPEIIRDKSKLHNLALGLIAHINMTPYGPPLMHDLGPRTEFEPRFGKGDIHGQTIVQLLTESDVVVHANDVDDSALLDLFSCRKFDPAAAVDFLVKAFSTGGQAPAVTYDVLNRTAPTRED